MFHCKHAFIEKAQHLRRWISLRTLTRGRLVPRQPRAIKRTTPTALHYEDIYIVKYIHWNNGIIHTVLHRCNIHIAKYIHRNTDITHTALYRYNIHHGEFIHWNTNISSTALHHEGIYNGIYILWNIGIISTVLRRCDIHNGKFIHWDTGAIPTAICTIVSFVCKQIVCYGIAFLSTLLFNLH